METQQQFRSLNKSHRTQCSIQRDVYGCHQVIQLDDGRAHAKSNCEVANSQLRGWARESCSFLPCVQLASTAHSLLWAEVLNPVQRLLFWGHHLRWVRHRGSNRCHYPLNWLGHASTFPSCLTSPYYNSLSSHYCHVVHVLCTYIIARHKNIECIECAQSQVVETNADLFRRNQLCLHRRFGRLALIAFLCVYSLSWRKWTLCSTSDGRISFVTSLLTGVGTIHWREEGRVEDVRSVGICSTTVKRNTVKRNTVQILCNVGDKTFDGRFISINISLCNKLHLTVHCVSCYLLHILLKTTFSFRNYPFHFNWMGAQRKALKRIKIGIAGEKQQDGLQIKIVDGTRD